MKFNRNLVFLNQALKQGKRGAVLEGSSRSGKTYAGIDFTIAVLDNITPRCEIIYIRETYNSFKTTLYTDFNRRFPQWELTSPTEGRKDVSTFWLPQGSKVTMIGADDPAKFHGISCDYFFINEALDVQQSVFDQIEQRCRRFWWMDYNPKASDHWIYRSVCSRPDVAFLHTTFKDNPYITPQERAKLLSYDPSNPANIEAGTADDYMWAVYGEGRRSAPEGLVFPLVTYVDKMPDDVERYIYGLDFGYTNDPTALVRVGVNGMSIYLEKLLYYPFENSSSLAPFLLSIFGSNTHFWADSADPGMIADLRRMGLQCLAVRKFPGSIQFGIDILKRCKIHIVADQDFRREQENYKWREVNGIRLNEPIDKYNHLWDATRYACLSELRQ
jgi:phage terminase large subunit